MLATGSTATAQEAPSFVYFNATVLTLDPDNPTASGFRVEADRITEVYVEAPDADAVGERIDLGGATVLPGLTDSHFHLAGLGAASLRLNLVGTRSAEEIATLVGTEHAEAAPGTWVRGRGWDQNDWEVQEFPNRELLDAAAPGRAVWLTRIDGHAAWVSSQVLSLAGITAETPDPEGGQIIRDSDGEPTGILVDRAMDLVGAVFPEQSPEMQRAALLAGLRLCREAGLTAVHDMGVSQSGLAAMRALEDEGEMTLRVTVYLAGESDDITQAITQAPDREGLVQVVGVKIFTDGAMGSRGAALLEPYSDTPESSGLLFHEPEALMDLVAQIHKAGYQVAIHAIGDAGNRAALDAIEQAQQGDTSRRHRIEHAQVVHPDDQARFPALGVTASMQPTHATSDMPWALDRLGEHRIDSSYAWRSLLEQGAALTLGSDAPVESENPWLGIYAAVTRQDVQGMPTGGWRADQSLSVDEALLGFTQWPATAAGQTDLGMIRAGYLADFVVVDQNPTAIEADGLKRTRTIMTVVGGRVVFQRED